MLKYSYPRQPFYVRNRRVSQFKILGERCSGTYYVQRLIEHNLELPHTEEYGHKHFWSRRKDKYPKDLLLVCVVREPFTWLESFFKKKWHVPEEFHSLPFKEFVTREFHSIKDHNIPNIHGDLGSEIMADRNPYTSNRYANLFELRHTKMSFMFHEFPKMSYNMIVLRLEDFHDDFERQLDIIAKTFKVSRKRPQYEDLVHYKGNSTLPLYKPSPLALSTEDIALVEQNLNPTWEDILNYRKTVT